MFVYILWVLAIIWLVNQIHDVYIKAMFDVPKEIHEKYPLFSHKDLDKLSRTKMILHGITIFPFRLFGFAFWNSVNAA